MRPLLRESLKRRLNESQIFSLASDVKWALRDCWRGRVDSSKARRCLALTPPGRVKGHVLLSYYIDPFLHSEARLERTHPQYWVSGQIARTFLDLGYAVDVISYRNETFLPDKAYDVVIDARHNLERLAPLLPTSCLKIFLIDAANIVFHNAAEAHRLLALQQRRGITLQPRRHERPNRGIEHADCGIMFGNAFTLSTFRYARKPLYRVPIPTMADFPWPARKDWDGCRRHFLFFSSGGMVHKGLDLVLETFATLPAYRLTVCAPVHDEPDFCDAYREELFGMSNIQTVGWVDIESRLFRDITDTTIAVVYPSCSEGGASAALTCLHAGLLPIVTYEASVDVDDFGVLLPGCGIEDIRRAVVEVASLPTHTAMMRARRGWEYAQAHYTRPHFAQQFRHLALSLLRHGEADLDYRAWPTACSDPGPVTLLGCRAGSGAMDA